MRYTILNVDDREASLYARSRTMSAAGFDVLEATTGAEAVKMASEHRPQVILLDVHLPDFDGLEVCRQIKANPDTASIQVLHVSAIAVTEPLQAMALESGADGYLVQPVDPKVLIGTTRALIRQWQKQDDLRAALEELQGTRQTLAASEARLRLAQHAAKAGVWEWNIKTGELRWSDEMYSLLGCDRNVVFTHDQWRETIHPADRANAYAEANGAVEEKRQFRSEYRISRYGEVRWLESIGDTIVDAEGNLAKMTGIAIDITERKKLETDLRVASEKHEHYHRLLEALMEYIPEGITVADAPDVTIRFVSKFGRELIGRTPETIEGISADGKTHSEQWGVHHSDGRPSVDDELPLTRSTKHGEVVTDAEWVLSCPDGRKLFVLCNSGPIRNGAGEITGGVIAWRDITERKQMEKALRESVERFRMATQAANEAIYEWNLDSGNISLNETYTRLYGRTEEAGSSAEWGFGRIHPEDRERVTASFNSALYGAANSWECEYRFEKTDGTWANVYDRAAIARGDDGKPVRIVGARLDTTELNVTRHQLRVLTGLLPICASCKKIRDTAGEWHVLEAYIHEHSEAKFSHGMCPECAVRWYGSGTEAAGAR